MKLAAAAFLAVLGASAPAADVFTMIGWKYLYVYGPDSPSPIIYQPIDTLPAGYGATVENNEGVLTVTAHSFRRRWQPGVTTKNHLARADFWVSITTDRTGLSKFIVRTRSTGTASASAEVWFPGAVSYARASTARPALRTREVKAHEWKTLDEESKGPATTERNVTVASAEWTENGDGTRVAHVTIPTGKCGARAVATCPGGGGGNGIAVTATATGAERIKAIGLKPAGSSGNYAGFVMGTMESFLESLTIEIRNPFNALIDTQMVSSDTAEWWLPFDYADGDYRLYFTAPGSLKKRVDITYASSVGVGGLDISLYYGDFDGNNVVTQTEVDAILAKVGTTVYTNAWFENVDGIGCMVGDLDINQDLQITAADYLLAVGNVGRVGD